PRRLSPSHARAPPHPYPLSLHDALPISSNLGSDIILNDLEQRRASGSNELSGEARQQIDALLRSKFRPEFLNRLDEIAAGRRSVDRKSTRLNSSHVSISYAVFCLKKKKV